MYISVDTGERRLPLKTAFIYLLVSVFCAVFGAVYEVFSHEVYSYFMIYAFGFPLVGGALPFLALARSGVRVPSTAARQLYHGGIATLTIGSLVKGALDIYGTTNSLTNVYWLAGGVLCVLGAAIWLAGSAKKREKPYNY